MASQNLSLYSASLHLTVRSSSTSREGLIKHIYFRSKMVGIPRVPTLQFDLFDCMGLNPANRPSKRDIIKAFRDASLVHPDQKTRQSDKFVPTWPRMEQINNAKDYLLPFEGDWEANLGTAMVNSGGFRSTWNPRKRGTQECMQPIPGHQPIGQHGVRRPTGRPPPPPEDPPPQPSPRPPRPSPPHGKKRPRDQSSPPPQKRNRDLLHLEQTMKSHTDYPA